MQDIENDMDDLFKRAAENYPIKPGNGDWESVSKKIAENFESKKEVTSIKNNLNRKVIPPIILLTLFLLTWFVTRNLKYPLSNLSTGNVFENKAGTGSNTMGINKNKRRNEPSPAITIEKNFAEYRTKEKAIPAFRFSTIAPKEKGISATFIKRENEILKKEYPDEKFVNGEAYSKLNPEGQYPDDVPGKRTEEKASGRIEKNTEKNTADGKRIGKSISGEMAIPGQEKNEKNISKKKGLYAGLIVGPDFSKVESKPFGNPGYSSGLLLGLRLHSGFSIETGIIINRKNYSSEGSIFSLEKIGATMPGGMKINNLKSQSTIWEFPIKVKYDFYSNKNSTLFIAGGASAYLMTKEKNKYNVTVNGNPEKMEGTYQKSNTTFPGVSIMSIGVEHRFSRQLEIRIEPYLKIPLQGMGVGKLPITSAGLQIGVFKRLK